MRTDLPVIAALTPDAAAAPPAGALVLTSRITAGLPHVMELLPRWRVVLGMPTGAAGAWLEGPAGLPLPGGAPRLRFQRDGVTRSVVPLVLSDPFEVVDGDRALLRAVVLGWALHVGDMRGPGDFGSFLSLAVEPIDAGAPSFGPLPPSDFVIAALPEADRTESRPASKDSRRYQRLRDERRRRGKEMAR